MSSVTLVLNKAYEPIAKVSWQRAITLVYVGRAEAVEEYEAEVRSAKVTIKIPAVIRLNSSIYFRPRHEVKFSKRNVFMRDGYICQYCYDKFREEELTFDHVVPVTQGGRRTWDNITTSCRKCNSKKEGRTPEQANMKLLKRPKKPTWAHTLSVISSVGRAPKEWKSYLYLGDY